MARARRARAARELPRTSLRGVAALALFPIGCALAALAIGQDANFDLLNYHYYDPYAFLHGRLAIDVIPASLQSYLNPLVDLPFYFLMNHTPPRVEAAIVGAVQGLNLVLVYLIARRVARSRAIALAAALAAGVAGGFASELGNSMGDTIVSIPLLAGVLCAVVAVERATDGRGPAPAAPPARRGARARGAWLGRAPDTRWWVAAGALAGVGAGLKLSELATTVGVAVASACAAGPWRAHVRRALATGLATAGGLALTAGYWTLHLWLAYGDPLLFDPASSAIFPTRYLPRTVETGAGFLPPTLADALVYPLYWLAHPLAVAEIPIRELSIPIAYVLCAALVLVLAVRPLARAVTGRAVRAGAPGTDARERETDRVLIVVFAVSIAIWTKQLGVYRYLVPVELLAPLVALAAGRRLAAIFSPAPRRPVAARRRLGAAFVALCALCAATAYPANYWLRVPFGSEFFRVPLPRALANGRVDTVFQVGVQPIAYIFPKLPPRVVGVGRVDNVATPEYLARVQQAIGRANRDGGGVFVAFFGSYGPGTRVPPGSFAYLAAIGVNGYHVSSCEIDHGAIGAAPQDVTFCRIVR